MVTEKNAVKPRVWASAEEENGRSVPSGCGRTGCCPRLLHAEAGNVPHRAEKAGLLPSLRGRNS